MTRKVPVPAGPVAAVSTELAYNGFSYTVGLSSGTLLTGYKSGLSHWGPSSALHFRRSVDGVSWSDASAVPLPSGYAWAHGGLASETAAQGGRVYAAVLRQHYGGTSMYTPTSTAAWLYWSDDEGTAWIPGPQLPTAPGSWGFYPSALLVRGDGTLLIAGYTSDGAARFLQSSDRGASLTAAGVVTIPGRVAQEPSLCELPDGRVFSLIRSDVGGSAWLYSTVRNADGSWAAPVVVTYDGSGLPAPSVVDEETIVALYRGWVDRTNASLGLPMRALMLGVKDGLVRSWRGNVDLRPGHHGRHLYGNVVRCGAAWFAVVGVEGPGGGESPSAQIVSVPIEFREAP